MAILKGISTKQEFFLLVIALFLIEFVRGAFVFSFLPGLSIHPLGISLTIIGMAVSIHFIGDSVTNLIVGYVMKPLGSNLVIHLSFFISLLSLMIAATWTNSFTMIFSALLLGIGVCPLWIVLLAKAGKKKRGQNISIVYFGWLAGIGAGLVTMNHFLQFNIHHILWFLPILVLIGWIIYTIANKGDISYRHSDLKEQRAITFQLLKTSKVVVPGLLFQGIAIGMIIPILPAFAINVLGVTTNQYSMLMLLGGGSALLFLVPIGKLVDHISNKVILFIIGLCLFALSLLFLISSPNLAVTISIVVFLGLCYALYLPAWNSFIASYIPENLKEAGWGIFSALQGFGVMIGPTVGSVLANQNNIITTIQFSAAMFGLTAVIYLIYSLWYRSKKLLL
ncbi:MFS transporter [Oceanobacillus chungangensis]|uniref:Major facilitator superfamily (MFS) profile domain-containing protein n=1 Tax=Oceanobacillus chungangensis TaxID=1229152 RepID=A0A3D8PK86_9BACI|nr:MFS transporter [Oceanobacillus chungangensis]RDW15605.1 hypothetical protein CWR45_17685 [Oceanobacillus chungangensis]